MAVFVTVEITIVRRTALFFYFRASNVNMLERKRSAPRVLEKIVRYKTLALSCFVLLGAMFAVPAAIWAVFLPSLKRGLSDAIPGYETILLDIAVFCGSWKWLLLFPLLGLGIAFTVAELASSRVPVRPSPS